MWTLVDRYTGRVGYRGGVKASGLEADAPVIDCSGWVALLLSAGMEAANRAANSALFSSYDVLAIDTWSDRIIEELERQSGFILEGDRISLDSLPPYATVGLRQGGGAWANNHPRPRGSHTLSKSFAAPLMERRSSRRLKVGPSRVVCG